MAAKQLDEMWDGQVSILNASYGKTVSLLEAGKVKDAYDEFHLNFAQAVKKIFSEAPQTYPVRFSKINDWCAWVKNLYIASAKTDKSLAAGSAEEAKKLLDAMRESFFKLHQETQTQQIPDLVYALYIEAHKEAPQADVIKDLEKKIADAKLPASVKGEDFAKARSEFDGRVAPLLADGKLETAELAAFRLATDAFYKSYGMQFE